MHSLSHFNMVVALCLIILSFGHTILEEVKISHGAQHLRTLVGQKCATSYEKYKLLEERDKILRKGRVKESDVTRAVVVRGTCPDMCPEKERYEREVQKRLSVFEQRPDGTVDHALAVKYYSRSSADQEEPLPHELRPGPVLTLTMDYLLGQMALECPDTESQLAAWYDFLWDKTRCIRKDITQQMMTDLLAVDLVEKCVRFHIYSAHRLCEQKMGDFDQKMNTENLTKSLQTLRHFYEDLEKAGKECLNEAEFRSYDVLLNLNDTDILRQVLSYRDSVRQSRKVRLGLKLFSAVQSNNYVGFFRMVREKTDYLQCCVVHRYFSEVRQKALNIICKTYTKSSNIPVDEFMRTLGFENATEAVEFCKLHGLSLSADGQSIVLARAREAFRIPEDPVPQRVSYRLIEPKRQGRSLGEILCGAMKVQSVILPEPVISFDEVGYYRFDPVIVKYLQEEAENFEMTNLEEQRNEEWEKQLQQRIMLQKAERRLENEAVRIAAKIFEEEVQLPVKQAATEILLDGKSMWLFGRCLDPSIWECAEMAKVEEMRRVEFEERKRRQEAICNVVDRFSEKYLESLVNSASEMIVQEVARRELLLAKNKIKLRKAEFYGEKIGEKVVKVDVEEFVEEICQAVYYEEVVWKLKRLEEIRLRLEKQNLSHFFQRWRSVVEKIRKKREILETFPSIPCQNGLAAAVEGLRPAKRSRLSLPGEKELVFKKFSERSTALDDWLENSWQWYVENNFGKETVERLAEIRRNLRRCTLRRLFTRWRVSSKESILRKNILNDFPLTPASSLDISELKLERNRRAILPGRVSDVAKALADRSDVLDQSMREESRLEIESFLEEFPDMKKNVEKENSVFSFDFDSMDGIAGFVSPNKSCRELGFCENRLGKEKEKKRVSENAESIEKMLAQLNSELKKEEKKMAEDESWWKSLTESCE